MNFQFAKRMRRYYLLRKTIEYLYGAIALFFGFYTYFLLTLYLIPWRMSANEYVGMYIDWIFITLLLISIISSPSFWHDIYRPNKKELSKKAWMYILGNFVYRLGGLKHPLRPDKVKGLVAQCKFIQEQVSKSELPFDENLVEDIEMTIIDAQLEIDLSKRKKTKMFKPTIT